MGPVDVFRESIFRHEALHRVFNEIFFTFFGGWNTKSMKANNSTKMPKCRIFGRFTLPETKSSPLKSNGWKMKFPFGTQPILRGELLVLESVSVFKMPLDLLLPLKDAETVGRFFGSRSSSHHPHGW